MRFAIIPAFLFFVTVFSPMARADLAPFGPTNQTLTFTGLGGNVQSQGVSRVTWGACGFDGTNTNCTVSAPFTGIGGGGTLTMAQSYQGNGPSNMTATLVSPNALLLSIAGGTGVNTLVENNGTTVSFYFLTISNLTFVNPTCTGTPQCTIERVGLTPGATITGTVTAIFDPTPVIRTSQGVISAGAFGGFSAVSPGDWMEIYGVNLGTVIGKTWANDFNGNSAPTLVGGTKVTIGGLPAFIDYVNPDQVNAQVPSGVGIGSQPVVVTTAGGVSTAYTIQVNRVEPGLLAPPVFKLPAGQYVAATFPDGVTFVLPPVAPGVPTARAKPGDTIIFYGVGFGPVTPDSPAGQIVTQSNKLQANFQAFFAGVPATVAFSGLTGGYLGLYQFNVVVPNIAASDSVPFSYSLDGVNGPQNLVIAIRN